MLNRSRRSRSETTAALALVAVAVALEFVPPTACAQVLDSAAPSSSPPTAASGPAGARPPSEPDDRAWEFSMPTSARAGVGFMSGYLTLQGQAGFVAASAETTPTLEGRRLRLRVPLSLRHRQAFGTPWTESTGEGAIALRYSPIRRFRVEVSGGASARLRREWLDQYQPVTAGELSRTHRYSRWTRFAELEVAGMPLRRHHARLSYRYSYSDYWADPSYDPYARPTHLVPMDRTEHELRAAWHRSRDAVRIGGDVLARHRSYYFQFARDAGTGATHAAAGGAPPNPLYRLWFLEPTADVRITPRDEVELLLAYGHEVQIDPFQGYFSFQGMHPSVELELRPVRALSMQFEADARYRLYGPKAYAESTRHPPLDSGRRRVAKRIHAGFTLRYHATDVLDVYANASVVLRYTNRPDYTPNVNPSTQMYDIDFDYTNVLVAAGIRVSN